MKKKTLINILILLALSILTFYILFKKDFKDILLMLKNVDIKFILLGLLLLFFTFFIDGYIISLLAKLYNPKYRLYQGFISRQYCIFFSGITPFSTGGEPFQVYAMTKQNLKIEESIGVVLIYFLLYKFALLSIAFISILFNYNNINTLFDEIEIFSHKYNLLFIIIICFSIIAILSISLIFLVYTKFFKKFLLKIIRLLAKIKIIKNPENIEEQINQRINLVKEQNKRLLKNKATLFYLVFLMLLRFIILYSIPFFCFYAINQPINIKYYFDTITLTSYTSLISGIMPSPGGSVGVEMAYQYLFSGFFSNKLNSETFNTIVKSSLLIWRFITYYFSILFSAIIVLIYRGKKKLNLEKGEFYDYTKHKDKQ